jgi:hypothetical protein
MHRVRAETGELGADLASVGVLEVFQDGERFFPYLAGLLAMPGGVMNVARVAERLGLAQRSPTSRYRSRARW